MEEAKAAIKDFTSKHGHHDTTVHEHHQPAVTHEHVTPTRHEEATTVVDREVHQDHHHTSVLPIHDREVVPEKHHHNIIPVEHKEHEHGDHRGVKERLAAEAAQFKHVSETGETQHTHEVKPVVAGEHVHHHVHETIQPIIQKETIQPSVIHTTIPVHEVHHNEPKHHSATALPAISMADFKKQGGSLTGREDRTDHFEGAPQTETAEQHAHHAGFRQHGITSDNELGSAGAGGLARESRGTGAGGLTNETRGTGAGGLTNETRGTGAGGLANETRGTGAGGLTNETRGPTSTMGAGTAATGAGAGAAGATATGLSSRDRDLDNRKIDPRVDQPTSATSRTANPMATGTDSNISSTTGRTTGGLNDQHNMQRDAPTQYADTHAGSKMDTAADRELGGRGLGSDHHHHSNADAANTTTGTGHDADATGQKKRTSLLDRLNPLKDSDGDGKKGIMK